MKTSKIHPPTYMLIAMLAMIALNFLFPMAVIVPNPWSLLGIVPIAFGVYISVLAEKSFRDARTTVTPFEESSTLVTSGMYRFSRNPMYLGFVLALLGISILLRSLTPLIMIPAFVAVIQIFFIRAEEQMLTAKFGKQYIAYTNQTRRWL
jgi:protein-S-isoprenylcysteine O-methyltransferase Ste14